METEKGNAVFSSTIRWELSLPNIFVESGSRTCHCYFAPIIFGSVLSAFNIDISLSESNLRKVLFNFRCADLFLFAILCGVGLVLLLHSFWSLAIFWITPIMLSLICW